MGTSCKEISTNKEKLYNHYTHYVTYTQNIKKQIIIILDST